MLSSNLQRIISNHLMRSTPKSATVNDDQTNTIARSQQAEENQPSCSRLRYGASSIAPIVNLDGQPETNSIVANQLEGESDGTEGGRAVGSSSHVAKNAVARIFQNGIFNVIGLSVSLPLQAVSVFFLAHRLEPAVFGGYFALFTWTTVIHFLSEAGVSVALTRRIAADKNVEKHFPESLGLFLLCGGLSIGLLVAMAVTWFMRHDLPIEWETILLAATALICYQLHEWCAGLFRGVERFDLENLSKVLQAVTQFCAILLIVPVEGGTLFQAFLCLAVGTIIAASTSLVFVQLFYGVVRVRLRKGLIRDWFGESIPIGFSGLFRRVLWQTDTLVLEILQSAAIVGVFSVAFRPLQPLQVVPVLIGAVTFPALSRLAKQNDLLQMSKIYSNSQRLLLVSAVPVSVLMTVYAAPIIDLCAGEQYDAAVLPFQILSWLVVLCFVSAQYRWVFTAIGRQREYAVLLAWLFVGKLVITSVMVFSLGMLGACWALLLSEAVLVVLGYRLARRFGLADVELRHVLVVGVAAAAMLATWLAIYPVSIFIPGDLGTFVGLIAYVSILFVFGVLTLPECRDLWVMTKQACGLRLQSRSSNH